MVAFGDHLPTMGLEDSDMKSGDIYKTKYVTWNNMGLKKQDADLYAYQLMASITDSTGIHEGPILNYHQTQMNNTDHTAYLDGLDNLQYDILYGNRSSVPWHGNSTRSGPEPTARPHRGKIKRSLELSNASLPAKFNKIMERFGENPDAMKQAGIVYATEQIIDLMANGVNNIHIYTMNKPDVAHQIMDEGHPLFRHLQEL